MATDRNKFLHLILTFLLGWGGVMFVSASNKYHSDMLEKMAATMSVTDTIEQLSEGYHYNVLSYNQKKITVGIKDNEVIHIGYTIFDDYQRQMINPVVTDFLERYWLWLRLPEERDVNYLEQMMQDKIFFEVGSYESIDRIVSDSTLSVSDNIFVDKQHIIEWKDSEQKTVCRINFPVNAELFSGRNILENDRRLPDEIKQTKPLKTSVAVHIETLPQHSDKGFYFWQGDSCYVKGLTSTRYYLQNEDQSYRLLYSPEYRYESIANMLTGTEIPEAADYKLTLRMQTYNYQQTIIETDIMQFVSYCIQNGCKAYVGEISDDGELLDVELLMRNSAAGYCHVLRMTFSLKEMEEGRGAAIARFNPFVPIANIKKLI